MSSDEMDTEDSDLSDSSSDDSLDASPQPDLILRAPKPELPGLPAPIIQNIAFHLQHGYALSLVHFAMTCKQVKEAVKVVLWQHVWIELEGHHDHWLEMPDEDALMEECIAQRCNKHLASVVVTVNNLGDWAEPDIVVQTLKAYPNVAITIAAETYEDTFDHYPDGLPADFDYEDSFYDAPRAPLMISMFRQISSHAAFCPIERKIQDALKHQRGESEIRIKSMQPDIRISDMMRFLDYHIPIQNPLRDCKTLEIRREETDVSVTENVIKQEYVAVIQGNFPWLEELSVYVCCSGDISTFVRSQFPAVEALRRLSISEASVVAYVPNKDLEQWVAAGTTSAAIKSIHQDLAETLAQMDPATIQLELFQINLRGGGDSPYLFAKDALIVVIRCMLQAEAVRVGVYVHGATEELKMLGQTTREFSKKVE